MSITRQHKFKCVNESSLIELGAALTQTLQSFPVDLYLLGELGAGKSTFVRGFLRGLNFTSSQGSPSFALLHPYENQTVSLAHIDLYRLEEQAAAQFLDQQDMYSIRLIEWADRLPSNYKNFRPILQIEITEDETHQGRMCTITFPQVPCPTDELISFWRHEVHLTKTIAIHCDLVAKVCSQVCNILLDQNIPVQKEIVVCAGKLHDLLRFIDFSERDTGHGTEYITEEMKQKWHEVKIEFGGVNHEVACTKFLIEKGYPEIAAIVSMHGLHAATDQFSTIEQKVLSYADKRVAGTHIVSIQERYDDIKKRYIPSPSWATTWLEHVQTLEQDLFPKGVPF